MKYPVSEIKNRLDATTNRLYIAEKKISKDEPNTGNYAKWNTKRKRL